METRKRWTREEREDLFDKAHKMGVTLNGRPAMVGGLDLDFPGVRDTQDFTRSATYCWDTLERVIDNGGCFKA